MKPDFAFLGWSEKQAGDWARLAERRFNAYGDNKYECDAGNRYSFGQLQAAAVRQWFATGEVLAELPTINRPGGQWRTKIRLLPSHWLSHTCDSSQNLKSGVYLDRHGAAIGFLFEVSDAYGGTKTIRKGAFDAYGRPKIIHVFDGAAVQVRGITPLAPVLRVSRQNFAATRAHCFDRQTGKTYYKEVVLGERVPDPDDVVADNRQTFTSGDEAEIIAKARAGKCDRDKGQGQITLDLTPEAQAEALFILTGARPGIDGKYRIACVTHKASRSGGATTSLQLKQPHDQAGTDNRKPKQQEK